MGSYPLSTIVTAIQGEFLQERDPHALIEHLCTDSRRITEPDTSLFFAIETNQRDGHAFMKMAYERGIRHFILHRETELTLFPDADLIRVPDTLKALQDLASYHRKQFPLNKKEKSFPVIGITGSNGKTIVKEWLYQLLHDQFQIVRSPKSYNSQIGVPLSVWQIGANDNMGLFEAGISEKGEMDALQKIIRPNIGILTSLGDAHQEGFASKEEKLMEKSILFRSCETVILPHSCLASLPALKSKNCITWGTDPSSTLHIMEQAPLKDETLLRFSWKGEELSVILPFRDEASVHNALTCCCVWLHLALSKEELKDKMKRLKPVRLRLEIKKGIHRSTIINDSYSADLTSFDIAFNLLSQQRQHTRRSVILSDLVLPREQREEHYRQLAKMIQVYGIRKVIAVGADSSSLLSKFLAPGTELYGFDNTDTLIDAIPTFSFADEAVLVKGARSFELERIIPYLEYQIHETVMEVNLSALTRNLKKIRSILQPGVRTMAVVKAFGYGSGTYEIANLLQEQGVDYLTVAFADEGVALRKAGITLPIMVMNAEPLTFDALTNHQLEPELFSFQLLDAFLDHLDKEGLTRYPVHLKIDTGMHRLGFVKKDWPLLAEKIANELISVRSVFSHLVASEDASADDFTAEQATLFDEACDIIRRHTVSDFIRHLSNSSGILRHPRLQYEMVRAGIALYGIAGKHSSVSLEEIMSLQTSIAQLKKIEPGETVGYNRKGTVNRPSLIATVRIGYADGFPRRLSMGRGKMLVNGKEAPVIGTVCMDMTMLDVTDIPGVKEGDPVLVFGKGRSISLIASEADTIPYEIMTCINQRVKRVYIEE